MGLRGGGDLEKTTCERVEFKETLASLYKVSAKAATKGKAKGEAKTKKTLTAYNRYISKRMKDDKMKLTEAVEAWKEDPIAKQLKDKVKELKDEDGDTTDEEIFEQAWAALYKVQKPCDEETKVKAPKDGKKSAKGKKVKEVESDSDIDE